VSAGLDRVEIAVGAASVLRHDFAEHLIDRQEEPVGKFTSG
jgi:hypothetical protein